VAPTAISRPLGPRRKCPGYLRPNRRADSMVSILLTMSLSLSRLPELRPLLCPIEDTAAGGVLRGMGVTFLFVGACTIHIRRSELSLRFYATEHVAGDSCISFAGAADTCAGKEVAERSAVMAGTVIERPENERLKRVRFDRHAASSLPMAFAPAPQMNDAVPALPEA
jgi:hypothetical protein